MMNDHWHIPRASLSSSAASSSAASLASSSNRSNRSTNPHSTTALHTMARSHVYEHQKERRNSSSRVGRTTAKLQRIDRGPTLSSNVHPQHQHHYHHHHHHQTAHHDARSLSSKQNSSIENGGGKRGSSSSQGSNKSNNSTRSAASGSLLLTAANLERFVEIHKKQEKAVQKQIQKDKQMQMQKQRPNYLSGEQRTTSTATTTATIGATLPATNYNSNLVQAMANGNIYNHEQLDMPVVDNDDDDDDDDEDNINSRRDENGSNHNDAIITMDPNLDFIKAKNLDNISIASSMHFTMVNGEGGPAKKVKRGLCDRGRQVTVLIISMSTIFLLLIMGMVYALEMRAREMPKS